ncbi:MAG: cobalamin-binding protein [Candidatus Dormibacteria bacterium]
MRIVSLLPSATEILFAIGAGPETVAVTHECDHPEAARHLPRVTSSAIDHAGQTSAAIDRHIRGALHEGSSIYTLDERLLARLRPELILTQELCDVCAVSYHQVEKAARRLPGEVPVVSLEPLSLEDICATIVSVGRLTGHLPAAKRVVDDLESRIARVVTRSQASSTRPRVACIEWTDPLMAGGHWVPEMVQGAGGEDALGMAMSRSRYVTWEDLEAASPEVMVLMPCGFNLAQTLVLAADLTAQPAFARLPCARSGRVFAVDGSSYFNRPGPRVVDGLEILARLMVASPGDQLPPGAALVDLQR